MRRFVIDEKHGGVTVTPALFKPVTAEITARKMGSLNIDFHTWGGGHVMSLSAGSPTSPRHSGRSAAAAVFGGKSPVRSTCPAANSWRLAGEHGEASKYQK